MLNRYFIPLVLFLPGTYANEKENLLDDANQLRTFFTSPLLRNQLDQLRNQGKYTEGDKASPSIVSQPVKIKMQGVVLRHNKTPVIFINNENTLNSSAISNEILINSAATRRNDYKVPVRIRREIISLKPGQQWDEAKKEVQDTYQTKPPNKVIKPADNTSVTPDNSVN